MNDRSPARHEPESAPSRGRTDDARTDGDESTAFEAIETAVGQTARGRWFLAEFARRNRHADTKTILDALRSLDTRRIAGDGTALPAHIAETLTAIAAELDDRSPARTMAPTIRDLEAANATLQDLVDALKTSARQLADDTVDRTIIGAIERRVGALAQIGRAQAREIARLRGLVDAGGEAIERLRALAADLERVAADALPVTVAAPSNATPPSTAIDRVQLADPAPEHALPELAVSLEGDATRDDSAFDDLFVAPVEPIAAPPGRISLAEFARLDPRQRLALLAV